MGFLPRFDGVAWAAAERRTQKTVDWQYRLLSLFRVGARQLVISEGDPLSCAAVPCHAVPCCALQVGNELTKYGTVEDVMIFEVTTPGYAPEEAVS